MENSSLFSNMKQRGINYNNSRDMNSMHDFTVKVSSFEFCSNYSSSKFGDGDLMGAGFSWPPRSYICSFCKRKFRSAQALGGHMNVHRRDRARLRQSPPREGNGNGGHIYTPNLNLEPNPSFHSNPSSIPSPHPPLLGLTSKFPTLCHPPIDTSTTCGGDGVSVQNGQDLMKLERFKNPEFVNLDLEVGFLNPSKEKLDLELRLGYI